MRLGLAIVALLLGLSANAQERKYAIMSLMGDGLLIVHQQPGVGSRLDRNERNFVPTNTPALDNMVILAIDNALHYNNRDVKTLLLGARNPSLFALQTRSLEQGSSAMAELAEALKPSAAKAGASHLLLAAKHRDEASMRMADGSVGAGKVEGFGFYINEHMRVENRDTGAQTQGFIAPFVYMSLTLVDLSSGAIVGQRLIRESHAAASQEAPAPWNALTPEQKVQMLQNLMEREVWRVAPELVK